MYPDKTFASVAIDPWGRLIRMHCISRAAAFVIILLEITTGTAAPAANNRQVLLLHSFSPEMRPWSDYAQAIRDELNRQSPWPLTITNQSVVSARYNNSDSEKPFVDYLSALFLQQPPNVVVVVGAPAAAFVQQNRGLLFNSTPMVLTTLEQRRIQYSNLTQNDAVIPIQIDYKAVIANILKVLPDTQHVAVVNGISPNEQFWSDLIRKEATSFADHIEFTFWDTLSFEDILKEAARLPPHSAIVWEGMSVDAAGVVHEGNDAFKRLRAASNSPVFGYTEPLIGQGVIGGPFNAISDTSRAAAAVVLRILKGEKPSDLRAAPLTFATPRYDARELKQWGIAESHLPPGSEIDFREPTAWERYRWQIVLTFAVLLLQGSLILVLLLERRRRRLAEIQARQRSAELAHLNRYSMAGELTAMIAHEINQPLGAILTNTETAELIVKSAAPDLAEVATILADIRRDDQRASDVIGRLRALLRKAPLEFKEIDLNDVARDTLGFLTALAMAQKITLVDHLGQAPLPIKGDMIQLQQVILNLIINAMDAMSDLPIADRIVTIASSRDGPLVEVSVSDKGPGVPDEYHKNVFEPFFTTKPHGMGMGLSIARTIVEAHGGQLIVANGTEGGADFHIKLPRTAAAVA